MKIIITGGCGFIGSSITRLLLKNNNNKVLNIDKLTKVSSKNLLSKYKKKNYYFQKIDICNTKKILEIFLKFDPDIIINCAAESHVDNSISSPKRFIKSNIFGTFNLLESSRMLNKKNFLFFHISTDEVYGSLSIKEKSSTEKSKYYPNSPYSASKASSDHLVRAWNKTYKINTIITNCCNNFGPWQYPEKLIPKIITACIKKTTIPIYGNGLNKREWIYVDDHSKTIQKLIKKGKYGESYNIGSGFEISNIALAKKICNFYSLIKKDNFDYLKLIKYVDDRKAHDFRYSIDDTKLKKTIGKVSKKNFDINLINTIKWYITNHSLKY